MSKDALNSFRTWIKCIRIVPNTWELLFVETAILPIWYTNWKYGWNINHNRKIEIEAVINRGLLAYCLYRFPLSPLSLPFLFSFWNSGLGFCIWTCRTIMSGRSDGCTIYVGMFVFIFIHLNLCFLYSNLLNSFVLLSWGFCLHFKLRVFTSVKFRMKIVLLGGWFYISCVYFFLLCFTIGPIWHMTYLFVLSQSYA